MSISDNIGSLSKHMRNLRSSKSYLELKQSLKKNVSKIPAFGDNIYSGLDHFRGIMHYAIINESIFEALGFKYYGPVDGHDLNALIKIFNTIKDINEPTLVHAITKKGKGYKNAEIHPDKFHGIGPFSPETGLPTNRSEIPSYSKIAGEALIALANTDHNVVAITAAMADGTGLDEYSKKFPRRFFDVGIAEQHAVTFAAGLALGGLKPFVCIYSTFLQRAFDQIITDVSLQDLPVVFLIDRAGNVGQDGETHHGVFDLSYLSTIPNMRVLAPSDGNQLRAMIRYANGNATGPIAIRFPRGSAEPLQAIDSNDNAEFDVASSRVLRDGTDLEIWTVGPMASKALAAAEILQSKGISAKVMDTRTVKPLDEEMLAQTGRSGIPIITVEDSSLVGGFGQRVAAYLTSQGFVNRVRNIGWPDVFVPQGNTEDLMEEYGLSANKITEIGINLSK
jgi:1-deoxy-D-xylulose-5-phosphate synthase